MEAKVSSNPSFVWRSLLAGRKLLKTGLVWKIGNGRSVKTWKGPWLPNAHDHKFHSPVQIFSDNATVSTLINEEQ